MEIADPDIHRGLARCLPGDVHSFIQKLHCFFDIGQEPFAGFCQEDLTVLFFKEPDPHFFFKLIDGITQRRLGNMQFLCCMGVVKHPGKSRKILKL